MYKKNKRIAFHIHVTKNEFKPKICKCKNKMIGGQTWSEDELQKSSPGLFLSHVVKAGSHSVVCLPLLSLNKEARCNGRINVEAGGKGPFVDHFIMNPVPLYMVAFPPAYLLPWPARVKLDKKVYFTMKWVGRDKRLTGGFGPSMQWVVRGSGPGQVGTICHHSGPLCRPVSGATASAGPIERGTQWSIYSLRGCYGRATETNWYIQALAPFGSHDTSPMDKKGHFGLLEILRKDWLPWRWGSKAPTGH